ncbi:MAG: MBL fold metallo-hydrolase [Clostridia bacterium]|nr:MBL fold metallo-hydrolase [Clostridia bacterium]
MLIEYFGHSYFKITGEEYSICLDPFSNVGLKEVETTANYLFTSHSHFDHDNKSIVKFEKLIDKSDSRFTIIKTFHDNEKGSLRGENNVLLFTLDGYKVAFLGDFGEENNQSLIEKLKGVDVLLICVGGTYTIDSKTATYYAKEIDAKLTIPMHYKDGASTIDIDTVQEFLKNKDYEMYEGSLNLKQALSKNKKFALIKMQK